MKINFTPLCKALVLASAILISVPGCKSKKESDVKPPEFKVLQLEPVKIPIFLQMVGQAEGIPTVEIRARVAGYLQSWSFKEGSIVQKGQLLFTIEPAQYVNDVNFSQAFLENKQAAWEKAKLDVARLKPLLATNAISQNDYDKAVTTEQEDRASVASAQAHLDQSKLDLSYTTMYAPITGYIGACNVRPGNLVGKGESTLLSTVSAVDPIYITFSMNETDYLKITRYVEENKAELKDRTDLFKVYAVTSDQVQYKYTGTIDFIDRDINAQTGTIAMRAVFPNPNGLIKPGTFTNIYLVLMEREDGILIPQSSTAQIQGKNFAFLVDKDNKVTRVPIVIGRAIGTSFIVNNGLKIGDRIMIEGFQKFKEGMQITPIVIKDTTRLPSSPVGN